MLAVGGIELRYWKIPDGHVDVARTVLAAGLHWLQDLQSHRAVENGFEVVTLSWARSSCPVEGVVDDASGVFDAARREIDR